MTGRYDVFVLPEQLTVYSVEPVKNMMFKCLNETESEIKCDGSDVTEIDTVGLQLLLMFYKSAAKAGKKFTVFNPSTELQNLLRYSGADKVITTEVLN